MTSITKIVEELYAEILDIAQGDAAWETLEELTILLESVMNGAMCRCLEAIVSMLSEEFYACAERRKEGWAVKSRRGTKTLLTPFGAAELQNDIYRIPEALRKSEEGAAVQKYTSPVLRALGIDPHERICKLLEGRLLKNALNMSYEKSAQSAAGGAVTRQTAMRVVQRAPEAEMFRPPEELRKAEVLDIVIDEGHPSLQHDPKGRKSTIEPLVVVYEGKYEERKNRNRLKHARAFVDMDAKTLIETIRAYVETTYDQSVLVKIRVHGDGAQWIRKAFSDAPFEVEHVLDEFHLERELRRLAGRLFTTKKERTAFRKTLTKALENNDEKTFFEVLDKYVDALSDGSVKKNCTKSRRYIKNNWESAVARMKKGMPGSCTEAMVEHILADRINGRAWSPAGTAKMGKLRAADWNKVDVCHPRPEERQPGGYIELCRKQIADFTRTPLDWSVFEHEQYPADGNSGTQHRLQLIALGGHRIAV